jgi:ABC-type bacteriocin/lantibiotic exporter with double-glycine peptidase domain
MKKIIPLTELSLEELNNKKKTVTGAVIGLGIVMLVACTLLIYLSITAKKTSLIAVAICCPIMFLPILINLQQINKEIKARIQN